MKVTGQLKAPADFLPDKNLGTWIGGWVDLGRAQSGSGNFGEEINPFSLLTYSMVQSPWEANWFAASQEIPRISRNPKVHYRTHKRPPPVSILDQPNPVHIPTSPLLEIHPNIIHPSTPRSPQWSLSLLFPHQDPIHPLSSPIRTTCPAHLRCLYITLIHILNWYVSCFSRVACCCPYPSYFPCLWLVALSCDL